METVWIDSKSACLSFLCTQSLKPVCGKCLDDDLSGCKNTASCLRWWMSNTPTTCHVLYIEAVTLASCGTNAAFPDCTASQVNCNSKSRSSERSSICSQKHMRASKPNPLPLSCTAGGVALHSSESLYGIQMDEKWERGAEIERNPPPHKSIWTAGRWNNTGITLSRPHFQPSQLWAARNRQIIDHTTTSAFSCEMTVVLKCVLHFTHSTLGLNRDTLQ